MIDTDVNLYVVLDLEQLSLMLNSLDDVVLEIANGEAIRVSVEFRLSPMRELHISLDREWQVRNQGGSIRKHRNCSQVKHVLQIVIKDSLLQVLLGELGDALLLYHTKYEGEEANLVSIEAQWHQNYKGQPQIAYWLLQLGHQLILRVLLVHILLEILKLLLSIVACGSLALRI